MQWVNTIILLNKINLTLVIALNKTFTLESAHFIGEL